MGNTLIAESVFCLVDWINRGMDDKRIWKESYSNGREQGLSLGMEGNNRKVAFSEDRHSDTLVVYYGTLQDFNVGGNVPDDKIYSLRKYFDLGELYIGAKSILDYLTGETQ